MAECGVQVEGTDIHQAKYMNDDTCSDFVIFHFFAVGYPLPSI